MAHAKFQNEQKNLSGASLRFCVRRFRFVSGFLFSYNRQ